ncbi:alpha/beta fold hydrolase [Pseudomonas sp. NPDC088368]|jgi:pimeloyl-ACP methyl ester carboxylesterase|uniref:alpha/beta fold hydrolase n=1 Tax=Pseudomonas sp. NPDC088368 TaxID=3364453 RepID=UPI003821B8E8
MIQLLALHGIQGSRQGWLGVARSLDGACEVVAPNLRGRGEAFRGTHADDYRLQGFVDDARAAADQLGEAGPFILAGWSMGASVALEYLSDPRARRPRALILISATPCLARVNWFRSDGPALLDEIAERERRLSIKGGADHDAVAWTWQSIRHTDQRSMLPGIDLPTLIIHGSDDQDCPLEHAHELAHGMPGARLTAIEGGGHSLLTQHTEQVSEHIQSFLRVLG